MNDVTCPYCDLAIDICHDDGFGMDECKVYQYECRACGKVFAFTTSISVEHCACRADCLNGGEHEWRKVCPGREICDACGERREVEKEPSR
jgi:hypothetical protein